MQHKIRALLIGIITKTPLESLARKVYEILIPTRGNVYDKQTFELMENILKSDSNCIDVGCYRGEILKEMIKTSPKGQHFAFEPVIENYKFLVNKFKTAKIFNMAVSDKKGTVTFHHVVGRAARSGIKQVEYPDKNQKVSKVKIKTDSLDNTIPKDVPINFIKIDVEGAELGVLKGAKNIISKYKPLVVFEYTKEKSGAYEVSAEDVFDFISKKLKYNTATLSMYLNAKQPMTKQEFVDNTDIKKDFYFIAFPQSK